MVCEEAVRYEDLYLDGEMAPDERLRMEAHLAACPACRNRVTEWLRFHTVVRQRMGEVRAPASLREALDHRLRRERNPSRRRLIPLALAASLALTLPLAKGLWSRPEDPLPLEDHAVATHLAIAGPEVQGDRATVESFLQARVPFPVRVPLPDQPGIRLLGARVARVGSRPAVVYLYDASGHRVSVTQYAPAGEDLPGAPRVGQRDGLTVVTYPAEGLVQTVVGDLPEAEVSGIVPAAWQR